jgi:hypothetical protein
MFIKNVSNIRFKLFIHHISINLAICENKGKTLSELMELFDLTNLVKQATCFMKNCKESLLDVILT